jgi:hypothetical protein
VDVDPAAADAATLVGATPAPAQFDTGLRPLSATPPPRGPGLASLDSPAPKKVLAASSPEQRRRREEITTMNPPLTGTTVLRMVLGVLLGVLSVLSLAGGVLLLLLWQQDRSSGVLSTQVERTWDVIPRIHDIEVMVAFLTVPFACAWAALVTINVRRTTGVRRSPIVPAVAIPAGVFGVWLVGDLVVAPAETWVGQAIGIALQAVVLLVPLLALEWVAVAAEAPRRSLRVAAVLTVLVLVQVQVLDGLSSLELSLDPETWGRLGAYLVIGALLVAMAALAINEGGRAIEDAAHHRFTLRRAFGATIVGQASPRR